ncbi:restriction endonuclease HindVIIP subunit R [[Actinobacillus] muris]|uniref:Type I restriction enzyme endonuclease subunit n=1 Tax=Muribacter muris TaxID=67855 RepID=A0A0J5P776_9PAST|nr:type I restriction endonuclease subunit R [Muribacter muris]KMK51314.1 restriction endonuclease HindVIIP subunit R [[Actinobacillus] muris] [Muribacter muris]
MHINENTIEQACLADFQAQGWNYTDGRTILADGENPWRERSNEVVFRPLLSEAVQRLNPQLPDSAVLEVVQQVCSISGANLAERNQALYRYLRSGVRVEYRQSDETKVDYARLVDFQQPNANRFDVINQLTIKGTKGNRRPDVIGYINGLPLVVIELKNPLKESASLTQAFNQLQTYKDEIADLFIYNQILVISDGTETKMGSLTANLERFTPWRVVDEQQKQRISFDNSLADFVNGLMQPEALLDYVQNFIVFESDEKGLPIKKIAAYHQFYGVNEAVDCTLLATSPEGDGKIGVMWHTQGSGKSLSMLFYAGKLLSQPALQNPTIVVVTDRNDLDGQLYQTFSGGKALLRQEPIQADGRDNLRAELAKRETGGILFTTIQKFGLQAGEERHPMLNDRHNIIVISDEAHRSQYGFTESMNVNTDKQQGNYKVGYAKHLRDALPNASFIGFTGTPISLEDKDTQDVFGRYVSIYDISDAVEDGATVPIFYDCRQIPLKESLKFNDSIQEVENLFTDDEQSYNFRLMEKLMGMDGRLEKLASDFVSHFEERTALMDGKAMIVVASRQICVKLYDKITALRPDWHSDDLQQGQIKIVMTGSAGDPAEMQPHIYAVQDKKTLEKRFKDPNDPLKVVIVRDMWLTGFDAPCCNTMYIDKPMRGHNLMQAIARVNRVFRNKSRENGGLVVDYIGLTGELEKAMQTYSKANGKGKMVHNLETVLDKMREHIDIIRGQFATPVQNKRFDLLHSLQITDERLLYQQILLAANHILGLDGEPSEGEKKTPTPRKNAFLRAVSSAKKGFQLCGTLSEAQTYRRELAFFDGVRAIITKKEDNPTACNAEDRQLKLVKLLDQAVEAQGTVNLLELLNRDRPNLNLLSDEFLEMVKNSQTQNLWLTAIERYLAQQIRDKAANNITAQKDFEQRLKEALTKYHNQSLSVLEVLEELICLGKDFVERLARGEKLGLSPAEIAFYDALIKNDSAVQGLGDETLKALAKEITAQLRQSATIDWQYKEAVRAKMRTLVRRTLKRYKYPPDQEPEAIARVLEQASIIADELSS